MMRMLKLEVKRIIKSKSTWLLAGIALLISLALALLVISFVTFYAIDADGNPVKLSGTAAIQAMRAQQAQYEGLVEPEFLAELNAQFHEIYDEYNGEIPDDVYAREIAPIDTFLYMASFVYRDPDTYYFMAPHQITPEQAGAFYEQRIVKQEEEDFANLNENALAQARALEQQVQKPFYFAPHSGWGNGGEYLTYAIFILAMICSVLAAPVFSSEYQTGSDNILRCTRYGRRKLAVVKLLSTIGLSLVLFALCLAVYLGVTCALLGTEGFKASLQVMRTTSPVPLTLGGLLLCAVAAGGLSMLAVVCFTLLVSSKSRSPLTVLIVSLAVVLLPTFLRFGDTIGIINWLRCLLPSGGVGLGNGVYYELYAYNTYLSAGRVSVWAPWIIVAAGAVWVLLGFGLTVRSYRKHEAA